MCSPHWKRVPGPLRETIWLLHANGNPRDGYAEACLNAISQVDETMIGIFPSLYDME